MDAKLQINYWLESAAHDMEAAETLFKNQNYDWCLFIGHLVIEKVLKAFYVRDKKEAPPWIHNLVRPAENTILQLSEEQLTFLANVMILASNQGIQIISSVSIRPVQRNLRKSSFHG